MGMIHIQTELLDREDLDIYSKMCCIYLVQAAQKEQEKPLTLKAIAKKMGCTQATAEKALGNLVEKGLLIADTGSLSPELQVESQRVRKKDRQSPTATFKPFDDARKVPVAEKLKQLRVFIHEPVTDGTLKIILNMASGEVERVKSAYGRAAREKPADVLEALMEMLQHDGELSAAEVPKAEQPASAPEAKCEALEPETRQVITQINQKRIAELYSNSKRKK